MGLLPFFACAEYIFTILLEKAQYKTKSNNNKDGYRILVIDETEN